MRRKAYEKCVGNGHKNNIRSIRFILGIFLIVSATLMSEHEMLQKIINAGGSAEGPGWFVAYTYCMNSVNMLLFVPIAVALRVERIRRLSCTVVFFSVQLYPFREKTVSRRKSSRIVGLRRFDSFFSHGVPSCNLYTEVRSVSFSD